MKRSFLLVFALLSLSIVTHAQNSSYNANAIPVGGTYSTAFGVFALHSNTGASNTATGYSALYSNTSGGSNTATGMYAMFSNKTGMSNTANGYAALYLNSTGSYNCAFGYQALYVNNSPGNTGMGYQSLYANTSGPYNTAAGWRTLYNNATGSQNTAAGSASLYFNTTGINNAAVGINALLRNGTGNGNVAVGGGAMGFMRTGNYNTATGYDAIQVNTTSSFVTAIGDETFFSSEMDISNSTAIGYNAATNTSNKVVIGDGDITSIGGQVGWTIYSDARVKKNFKEDVPGLAFINALKPVTYNYNIDKENELLGIQHDTANSLKKRDIEKIKFSGFVAQDVQAVAQKIEYNFSGIDKTGNIMGLRYADFVVPIVKAIQERQAQIDELKKIMEPAEKNLAALEQNTPNPFTMQTVICYNIPLNAAAAQLVFYDARGRLIATHNITEPGRGQLTVSANNLSKSVYSYTLVVDGKKESTKQLIKQ